MCFQLIKKEPLTKNSNFTLDFKSNGPTFFPFEKQEVPFSNYKKELLLKVSELNKKRKAVSIEHMRLMIYLKKIAYNKNFFVLTIDEFEEFTKILVNSSDNLNRQDHFQLIIENNAHYTTVDILWGAKKECLVLDAARDLKGFQLFLKLQKLNFENFFLVSGSPLPEGKANHLQKDWHSCALFAVDHALQVSFLDVYNRLKSSIDKTQKNEPIFLVWEDLPASLVWNAQSYKFLNSYLEKNKEKIPEPEIKKFQSYLNKNKTIEKGKPINQAIFNLFESEKKNMLDFIKGAKEDEIKSILCSSALKEISDFLRAD